jgi:hypothetical protein
MSLLCDTVIPEATMSLVGCRSTLPGGRVRDDAPVDRAPPDQSASAPELEPLEASLRTAKTSSTGRLIVVLLPMVAAMGATSVVLGPERGTLPLAQGRTGVCALDCLPHRHKLWQTNRAMWPVIPVR